MHKNKNTLALRNNLFSRRLIIPFIVVAMICIYFSGAYFANVWPFGGDREEPSDSTIDMNEPTDEQLQAGEDIKKQSVENPSSSDGTASGSDPLPEPEKVEGSDTSSVHAEITAANQVESELLVRALIQTVSKTGMCSLTISNSGGQLYSAAAGVQALPNGTTCKGFDIPLDRLAKGSITIKVDYAGGNIVASTSKSVEIE